MFDIRAITLSGCAALAVALSPISANSATVHGVYTSTVDTSSLGGLASDPVVLDYFYSTPMVADSSTSGQATYNTFSDLSGTLSIGSNVYNIIGSQIFIQHDGNASGYDIAAFVSGSLYGFSIFTFRFGIYDLQDTMLTSTQPPTFIDISLAEIIVQFLATQNGIVTQNVEPTLVLTEVSNVPVPAALPLFAAGLGAMGFMGWRRRKAAVAG